MDFDAGNNAEIGVTANLCQEHFDECERTGYEFEQKYSGRLEELANQAMSGGWL